MPERQRAVVMLRDVDGLRSDEVCQVLDLTPANERVLLHRGRSRLRQALEDEIGARRMRLLSPAEIPASRSSS